MEEQHVQETTGHRSNAVRGYKRTSDKMHRLKSEILYGNKRQCETPVHGTVHGTPSVIHPVDNSAVFGQSGYTTPFNITVNIHTPGSK